MKLHNPRINFLTRKEIYTPTEQVVFKADIERFEQDIGFKLPQAYIDFLLKYNGSDITPSDDSVGEDSCLIFHIDHFEGYAYYNMDIVSFYNFERGENVHTHCLQDVYQTMTSCWSVPAELLPIAFTCANKKIFLGLEGVRCGNILIGGDCVNQKISDEEELSPLDFIVIAPTLNDFINQLDWCGDDNVGFFDKE